MNLEPRHPELLPLAEPAPPVPDPEVGDSVLHIERLVDQEVDMWNVETPCPAAGRGASERLRDRRPQAML